MSRRQSQRIRASIVVAVAAAFLPPVSMAQVADRTFSGNVSLPMGFTVPAGKVWDFDPSTSTTVVVEANVVVEGTLRMKPSTRAVVHVLRFANVDESKFQGGGMSVMATDIGLWVIGAGRLEIEGTPTRAWDHDWQAEWEGNEVLATPYLPGDATTFTPWDKTKPRARNRLGFSPELLNLTRNVVIGGTPQGRTHVWVSSSRTQRLRFARLEHVGPRKSAPPYTEGVLGRYGLHLHMMGDFARGTLIEGVVVRASGNRAFVPHASHGITLRDCIAYDCFETPYWWDPPPPDLKKDEKNPNATHDLIYDRCVAALVQFDPPFRGYRLAGFELGNGDRNACVRCVATGVQGNKDSSGFHWPEGNSGVWLFERCVAHNNARHGIFVWQNTGNPDHVITRFLAYYNGGSGISHGAYSNGYLYQHSDLLGNAEAGVSLHATGRPLPGLRFEHLRIEGDGITPWAFKALTPNASVPLVAAHVVSPCITGMTQGEFVIGYTSPAHEVEDRFRIVR